MYIPSTSKHAHQKHKLLIGPPYKTDLFVPHFKQFTNLKDAFKLNKFFSLCTYKALIYADSR